VGCEVNTAFKLTEGAGPLVVHRADQLQAPRAEELFGDAGLLAVDGVEWDADLKLIRTALVKKKRKFKEPFIEKDPPKEVRKELRKLEAHAERLFAQLYPSFKSVETRVSFRPMITGPEPLHFDTYGGEAPMVTAYINVSNVPRVYGIGPNFPSLLKTHPKTMRSLAEEGGDLSYVLRQLTAADNGPLDSRAPRHRVEFAPGAIWFFNAKTVSHEVIYGTGALGISWECPDCGAPMQADLLKEML
jgi:hypothetical protein